jgi:putative addiction module killer protein
MKIEEYVREDDSNPFKKWFDKLDRQAAAKVTVALARLELGNTSAVKWFSGIGEYRIHWGPGYRIYLAQQGDKLIILFGGGTKRTQQADIKKVNELFKEYKERIAVDRQKKR